MAARGKFLHNISYLCKQNNVDFLVAFLPIMIDFDNYPFLPSNKVLIEYCRAQDIDHIDLLPYLRGQDYRKFHVSLTDSHARQESENFCGGVDGLYTKTLFFE